MKIDNHIIKAKRFLTTLKKLDYNEDSETIIEILVMAASHYVNAAMHKLRTIPEDRDIKHNHMAGIIKREKSLGDKSEEISELVQHIEQFRPSYVYGKSDDERFVKKCKEAFDRIQKVCEEILNEQS